MNIKDYIIKETQCVHEAMKVIDRGGKGFCICVDENGVLVTTLTDGDIRRAILDGVEIDDSIEKVKATKKKQNRLKSVCFPIDSSPDDQMKALQEKGIRFLPLVDNRGYPVKLLYVDDLSMGERHQMQAVVMAGGMGTRLHPLTLDTPKPMLLVKGKPILEWIVEGLKSAGIHRMSISTHYKGDQIVDHFKKGESFGVDINYLQEDTPLGTAGALSLLDPPEEPFIVMNGDIFTEMDYQALMNFHHEHDADITVCVRKYQFTVPYGVIRSENSRLTSIEEKPKYDFFVNAGIYLVEPEMLAYVPKNVRFDMTDLLKLALEENKLVATFPIIEQWVDIGHHDDYQLANQE